MLTTTDCQNLAEQIAADTAAVFHMITPQLSDLGGIFTRPKNKAQMVSLRFAFRS
jgi:hypothetical protein